MPLALSLSNIFEFMMSLGPIFISSFLMIGSAFNQNAKGFVYLGGMLITVVLGVIFKQLFKHNRPAGYSPADCELFTMPNIVSQYSIPDLNSTMLAFSAAYLLWPMFKGETQLNAWMAILLVTFLIGNGITRVRKLCNGIIDVIIGVIFGFCCGTGWFFLFWLTDNKKLLFIDDLVSNRVACNRPSKQTFKCGVYKNGELVKNL